MADKRLSQSLQAGMNTSLETSTTARILHRTSRLGQTADAHERRAEREYFRISTHSSQTDSAIRWIDRKLPWLPATMLAVSLR